MPTCRVEFKIPGREWLRAEQVSVNGGEAGAAIEIYLGTAAFGPMLSPRTVSAELVAVDSSIIFIVASFIVTSVLIFLIARLPADWN